MTNIKITLDNFDSFIGGNYDYDQATQTHTGLWLRQEKMDVGGGEISFEDIDVLKNHPEIDTLTISGLHQDTFEYFIKTYGQQLRAVRFFKNKLVEDWSLLSTLKNIEFIYYFANQRITQLWDMSGNNSLIGLGISDFTRLHNLEGIQKAPNLQWFSQGDAIWSTSVIESFECLKDTRLSYLSFSGKSIDNPDLTFLHRMPNLHTFDFPTNLFTTEQVAWVVANFPLLEGFALKPYLEYNGYNSESNSCDIPMAIITGKRKPTFPMKSNETKLQKYAEKFNSMVEKYKGIPFLDV